MKSVDLYNFFFREQGMCTCGNPEAVITLVRDALEICKRRAEGQWDTDSSPSQLDKLLDRPEHPGLAQAFLHILDKAQLIEHGGNIFGSWATPRGISLLRGLDEHGVDDDKWDCL